MAEKRSAAVWIGIGCAVIIGLATITVGGCFVFLYTQGRQMSADMENPVARTDRVLEVLRTDRIPDGYHALAAFRIPFLVEVAVLTDRAPDAEGKVDGFEERGFIYTRMIRMGQDEAELRDFFEGRTDDPDVLADNGFNLDVDEIIGRGVFELPGRRLMYVSQRGDVSVQGQRGDGIASIVWIDCDADERVRIGIWFGPDPDPDLPPTEIDLSGTPADESALRDFLAPFEVCR